MNRRSICTWIPVFLFTSALVAVAFGTPTTFAASKKKGETFYFSCTVLEPSGKKKDPIKVTVKFAVKDYVSWEGSGELFNYPGANEDSGAVYVYPEMVGKNLTMMSNLNGQGGDLRVEGTNLRLWGDGDGYQFTELVVWDADEDKEIFDGYVRDYGPTYGDSEIFKQFIKCKRSNQVL